MDEKRDEEVKPWQPHAASRTVSQDMADKEFARFVAAWDIDANIDSMTGEDKESFEQQKKRIITKIMTGDAVIDDAGNIVYNLRFAEGAVQQLTFRVPNGAAYMAMDRHKDRQNIHKLYEFMGAMTKQAPKLFASMDARDVKFCQGVALLFLGS